MASSKSDKGTLFAENFSKNSHLDDSGIFLPGFPSRTTVEMHNIPVTPWIVKMVITDLDSSKASGPDCIPVLVLKKFEPELSYILAEHFNMCLKESCFPDCWKASSVVLVFNDAHITFSTAPTKMEISLSLFIFTHAKYRYLKRKTNFLFNHGTHNFLKRFFGEKNRTLLCQMKFKE